MGEAEKMLLEKINLTNAVLNLRFKDLRPRPHRNTFDLLSDFQYVCLLTIGIKVFMVYIRYPLFRSLVLPAGMSFTSY